MSAVNMVNEVSQESIDNALSLALSIDLSKINAKLQSHCGMSSNDVCVMSDLYRKWLALHICYPNVSLTPNELLDEYWHTHILDTRAYSSDCEKLFGFYLHHYPYFGLEGDEELRDSGFDLTKALFKKHFGQELIGVANPCKSTDCR